MMEIRPVLVLLASVVVWCVVGVGAAVGAPGDLDATFGGGDGMVTTDFSGDYDEAHAVVIDSEGRIVVAGDSDNGSNDDFAVVRYTADGVLDTSFGTGGIVTTDINGRYDRARAVAVASQGRVVVAGSSDNGSNQDFAVVRYTADGVLDTSFGGGDGVVTTDISGYDDWGHALVVDSAGRIVVAGSSHNGSNEDFAVVRYTADGVLDTSFGGGDGVVTTGLAWGSGGIVDEAYALVVDSAGRIVVVGDTYHQNNDDDYFAVVRYTSAGVLDTSFGTGGIVTTDIASDEEDEANAVAIDSEGRIVVAGDSNTGREDDFAVVRYTSAGVLDTSFGGGDGVVKTDISGYSDTARAVALDSEGRIVVAGKSGYYGSGGDVFTVVRYTSAGVVDTSFGGGDGIVTTNLGLEGNDDEANGLAMDSQGRIVVVGEAAMGVRDDDFGVVRYLVEDSVPAAPTGVVALPGEGLLAVTWAAPFSCWNCATAIGGQTVTDYVVEYSSDGGVSWSTFTDGTSASTIVMVTGLSNGVGYVFRVSAVDSAGTGSASVVSAVVVPAPAVCTIVGTPGDDVLVGTSGADHICGFGGDDKIYGKAGYDVLDGGPGNDVLKGGKGKDRLYGRRGRDSLKGGPHNDRLWGHRGSDKLWGQAGKDKLWGQAGTDILDGGPKKDVLNGGKGKDIAKKPGPDRLESIYYLSYGKTTVRNR